MHWAEYCYNITFHSSLGTSPFKAVYGQEPLSTLDYVPMTTTTEGVDKFLVDRQDLLQELKDHLAKGQAIIKKFADGHRRDLQFSIEHLVFLNCNLIDNIQ